MRPYEMMILMNPDIDEPKDEAEKVEEVVRSLGGEIAKTEVLGKKRLAYEVQKKNEGYYVLSSFKLEPEQTFELKRVLGLRPNIWRQMLILLDE